MEQVELALKQMELALELVVKQVVELALKQVELAV